MRQGGKKMKKSYNPFKMWGAWVGAGLGLYYAFFAIGGSAFLSQSQWDNISFIHKLLLFPALILDLLPETIDTGTSLILAGVISIVVFFLIGWGIHSLVRKLRK